MEKTTLEMNTDLFDQQFQGRQFVSNGRVGLTSRVWDYWMDQYRTIPPSFSLYFGASNSWIPNLMVLRTRTGSILGCPWNLVTILSKLGCNLLRGLTTYLYRAYNLFTKFHGHRSTRGGILVQPIHPFLSSTARWTRSVPSVGGKRLDAGKMHPWDFQPWHPCFNSLGILRVSPHFFQERLATSSKFGSVPIFFKCSALQRLPGCRKIIVLGILRMGKTMWFD